jgi:hypothetical protein
MAARSVEGGLVVAKREIVRSESAPQVGFSSGLASPTIQASAPREGVLVEIEAIGCIPD